MANQVSLITEVSSVENCAALSANALVILQRRASKENPSSQSSLRNSQRNKPPLLKSWQKSKR